MGSGVQKRRLKQGISKGTTDGLALLQSLRVESCCVLGVHGSGPLRFREKVVTSGFFKTANTSLRPLNSKCNNLQPSWSLLF